MKLISKYDGLRLPRETKYRISNLFRMYFGWEPRHGLLDARESHRPLMSTYTRDELTQIIIITEFGTKFIGKNQH